MATTWPRKRRGKLIRNDPYSKTDALAARRVLRDAHRARNDLFNVASTNSPAAWRLRWITAVTILRAVGHVLRNIDARRSSGMKAAIQAAWRRWDQEAFQHLIFHEFIKRERDTILKEYHIGTTALRPEDGVADAIGPNTVLVIGDQKYTVKEAINSAISWWESEINRIEAEAGNPQS